MDEPEIAEAGTNWLMQSFQMQLTYASAQDRLTFSP